MKKRLIIFSLIIVILITSIVIIVIKNSRTELNKKITISKIVFSDVKIYKEKEYNYFKVKLSTNEKEVKVESIDIIIYDKNNKEIVTLPAYVGDVSAENNKILEVPTNVSLKKAYRVNYVVYRE